MPTAQSVTITETRFTGVKEIKWDWLATDAGAVVGSITTNAYDGIIIECVCIPDTGGTAPDNLYDITITDGNSQDILNGNGANLSGTATVVLDFGTYTLSSVAGSKLTLAVSGAGDANGGIVILRIV
jgi:hypothetical protein